MSDKTMVNFYIYLLIYLKINGYTPFIKDLQRKKKQNKKQHKVDEISYKL